MKLYQKMLVKIAKAWEALPSEVRATVYITLSIILETIARDLSGLQYSDLYVWGIFISPSYQILFVTGIINILLVTAKKIASNATNIEGLKVQYNTEMMGR